VCGVAWATDSRSSHGLLVLKREASEKRGTSGKELDAGCAGVRRGRGGRYLVRLSDSLFFAPQSDSEKKKNAIRKSSARNNQIRGLFGSPP
jgi:hypothetical protein